MVQTCRQIRGGSGEGEREGRIGTLHQHVLTTHARTRKHKTQNKKKDQISSHKNKTNASFVPSFVLPFYLFCFFFALLSKNAVCCVMACSWPWPCGTSALSLSLLSVCHSPSPTHFASTRLINSLCTELVRHTYLKRTISKAKAWAQTDRQANGPLYANTRFFYFRLE